MDSHWFPSGFSARRLRLGLFTLFLTIAAVSGTWAEDEKTDSLSSDAIAPESLPVACTNTATSPVRKLFGVVSDQTGSSIARVQITLACGDFRVTTTTDGSGTYSLTAPIGKYRVVVEAANFGIQSQEITLGDAVS